MKKVIVAVMVALFLVTTEMVLADATNPAHKAMKTHKGKKKHNPKAKVELNPQPLPPSKIPVDGSQTGPGGVKPQ